MAILISLSCFLSAIVFATSDAVPALTRAEAAQFMVLVGIFVLLQPIRDWVNGMFRRHDRERRRLLRDALDAMKKKASARDE